MTEDLGEKIPIRVSITDTTTGETRAYDADGYLDDGVFFEYIWSEGNYACDCNRANFFARAAGEDDPDRECGDGRYAVKIFDIDGKTIYEDG